LALADNGPVGWDPTNGLLPDHAPEALQEVAFAAVHDNVERLPLAMLLGEAPS
jgi:hypothetical protein